jgi:hypothetical protein
MSASSSQVHFLRDAAEESLLSVQRKSVLFDAPSYPSSFDVPSGGGLLAYFIFLVAFHRE